MAGAEQLLIAYSKAEQADVLQKLQEALQTHGGWLGSYLPDNSVLGIGNAAAAQACMQIEGVIWVVS